MANFSILFSSCLLTCVSLTQAQAPPSTALRTSYGSDTPGAGIAEQNTRDQAPKWLLFVELPQYGNPVRDDWRLVHSHEEQEQSANHGNSVGSALVRDGHIVVGRLTFQSESGDWANYVEYCYRPDGTLIHLHALLNTFHGDMRVVRDSSYDYTGVQTAHSQVTYELGTLKPKPMSSVRGRAAAAVSSCQRFAVCEGFAQRARRQTYAETLVLTARRHRRAPSARC